MSSIRIKRLSAPTKALLAVAPVVLAFAGLALAAPYVPDYAAAAPDPRVPASTPTLSMASGLTDTNADSIDDLDLAGLTPTITGSVVSAGMTMQVSTNNPTGYTLGIAAASSNLVNTTNGAYTIPSVTGSISAPIVLGANRWGFAVPKTQTDSAGLVSSGFDNTYTAENNNQSSTSKWAAVPTTNTTIKTTSVANPTGNATTVFFGVKGTTALPSGAYKTSIIYTATTNSVPSPVVTSISPNSGPLTGGGTATITGNYFYDQASTVKVTIGGVDCTSYTVVSTSSITCVVPAGTAGSKDVKVTTISGGTTSLNGGYTYTDPVPTVTSISPNSGHFRGGETFTITGANFTGATVVNLGGSNCRSYTVVSDTSIKCVSSGIGSSYLSGTNNTMTAPTNTVSVNVTNPNGSNTANTLFTYRYINSSFTGGNSFVDITGTDIALGSKIFVDGVECTNRKITSATTAACNSPARGAGSRNVTIQAPAASAGNIQSYTGCSALAVGTIVTLTDTRDGQNYRIRKMEDGKCWMIDNLKLAGGVTLTSANTNLDANVPADFTTTFGSLSAPVQATATHGNGICTADSSVATAAGSAYLTCDGAAYADANDGFVAYSDPAQSNGSNVWSCINQAMISPDSLTNCGYLYNWYTATAGTGNFQKSTDANATASICPAGWHLPYNTSTNDFGVLNNSMLLGTPSASSTTSSATTRPNWRYNGKWQGSLSSYYAGDFYNQGVLGYYWSARASSSTNAYYLNFFYGSVNPGNNNLGKYYGMAVRCML